MRPFSLVLQALLVSCINATTPLPASSLTPVDHLAQPLPTFTKMNGHGYDVRLINSLDAAFAGYKSTANAKKNAREFNAAMANSRFQTLSEIIDTAVPDCGATSTSAKSVNVSEMSDMIWRNDKNHKGLRYHGPCEAWIDDTRVYSSPDCRADHKEYPAKIPIDYSVCMTECTFKFYWLAVDYPGLKAYKQCAKVATHPKPLQRFKEYMAAKKHALQIEKYESRR